MQIIFNLKKHLLFFLSACAFISCSHLKSEVDALEGTYDSLAIQHKASFEIPGLAIGIIRENKIIYAKGFGVQAINTNRPLTTQSIFHMASVSKPFVATAIVQLVESGNIKLDARLVDYLPYFRMNDERYSAITIRQMLNHTSGIPDVTDYEWNKPQYDDAAAERYAKSFATSQLEFTPGEKFRYSNAAFDILADVIARVSGMTFERYVKTHIFEPVGMTHSTFYKPDVPLELATSPHVLGDSLQMSVSSIYPYNRIHAPSSTLHSNVEDMLRWAMLNLNKGVIDGKKIYDNTSYDLLTRPQLATTSTDSVCLSWFSRHLNGYQMLMHSGGDEGYRTYIAFIPKKKAAVVVMANNDYFPSRNAGNIYLQKLFPGGKEDLLKVPIHFVLKNHILIDGIEKTKEVYFSEKTTNPASYHFEGWHLDDLGFELLDRGYFQQALEVFKFNIELYPNESGFYDSVGDAYRAMDNKELAIEWYKKALEINPDQKLSKRKLEELSKK